MLSSSAVAVILILILLQRGAEVSCADKEKVYISRNLETNGNTVVLGGLFPLHATSNNQACSRLHNIGLQQAEAMVFAVNRINRNSNILPNVTLAFNIRDSCTSPSYALTQAFQFVQNRNSSCMDTRNSIAVSGVVGAAYSSVSIDIANLLRLHKIPQISHVSSSDLLSDKTRFDYFLRTVPPDSIQARAIADIIVKFNWSYVFALYSDDSYGEGGIEATIQELENKKIGVCIAAKIALSVTATPSDYDAAVKNMSLEWVQNASSCSAFLTLG